MTDSSGFEKPSDPSRQPVHRPAPQADVQRPAPQYAAPQYAPQPMPQGGAYPGQYAAPQYAPPVVRGNVSTIHLTVAWVFAVLTFGYMLPWAIAATRGKSNTGAIGLLNLFLGWSVIGWVVALIMSCGAEHAAPGTTVTVSQTVAFPQQQPYYPPAVAVTPAAPVDPMSQISKLAEMRDAGHLTEDEFTAAKAKLLA